MSIPTTSSRWPSGMAYTAALIFTLASAGTNLAYGWQKGTDLPSSVIWAAVSLAVAIVFALSWPAVVGCIEHRRSSRTFMAALALLLTGMALGYPDPADKVNTFAPIAWRSASS